jgi:choline dehydrogenase-like flavoprotein
LNIVIGSGPAGVACAAALLARGRQVTMLDAGLRLEPEREAVRAGMAAKPKADWTADERALVTPQVQKSTVPEKLSYGSDYPYRGTKAGSLRGSYAQGGLSNVWGSAMLPYRARDIADWPVRAAELAPGYRAAMELLPVSAERDDLEAEWPIFAEPGVAMARGAQVARLMRELCRHESGLRARGVRFGAARVAVRAADCITCGACLNGCPRELIYSARHSLAALQARGMEYVAGFTVERIAEHAAGVEVFARDGRVFSGTRVFVAAGVLNTAEIMLRSTGRCQAVLLDSQYYIFPWLQAGAAPDVRREALHTLAQMFVEIDDPAISPFGVHLQVYGYSDIVGATLAEKLGALAKVFPAGLLLNRMLIVQGYLHSAHSGTLELRLEDEGVTVTPRPSAVAAEKVGLVLRKLGGLARLAKAYPLRPLLQVTEPGRGFHAGGSFPMAAQPKDGQTDILGRVPGWRRTHLVDASVFPSIAATTITLTAMANAWRIGDAAALEG